jgi:competence protein ComEC
MPEIAVISVGKENSYGHPTEETLSRLRDADVKVYRTDMQGDIIISSNGKDVVVNTSKNKNANTIEVPTKVVQEDNGVVTKSNVYIGNIKSKKFHMPSCYSLPIEKNRIYLNSRTDAINNGFSPCGNCIGK